MKDSDVQREIDRMTENRTNQALPMTTINTTMGEPYVSVIDCGDTFAIQLHRYGRVVVGQSIKAGVRNGVNFYPLTDKSSFGFRFRYGHKNPLTGFRSKIFWFRYSRITQRWTIENSTNLVGS